MGSFFYSIHSSPHAWNRSVKTKLEKQTQLPHWLVSDKYATWINCSFYSSWKESARTTKNFYGYREHIKEAAVLTLPFRQGSRSSIDMAIESSQMFLLLAVLVLGIFGKEHLFLLGFGKNQSPNVSRSNEIESGVRAKCRTHSKHYPQWWKIEIISFNIRNKARVPTLSSTI